VKILEEMSEELRQNPNYWNKEKHFEVTRALKAVDMETIGPCDAGFPIYVERNMPVVFALKGSAQITKEQDEYIPRMLKVKLMPVINVKMEANMGVISPFTHELIGSGLDMAMHMTLPFEMIVSRQGNQVTMALKSPEQITNQIETIHVYAKPYTMKKDLIRIQPVSKATNLKVILSGEPLKTIKENIGQPLELDVQIIGESDNKYVDLYSYWQKIRQHNLNSLVNSFFVPSTIRWSSGKIVFNPQQSKTKELSLTFSLRK